MFQVFELDNAHAAYVVERLEAMRQEMEHGMPGGKLRVMSALVIFDVCNALHLAPEERRRVLGDENYQNVERLVNSRVRAPTEKAGTR